MIKICSLDFLNREVFETDVMSVDGEVLFPSGETITPEILLRLYFKEIYIAQPLTEKERVVNMVSATVYADVNAQAIEQTDIEPVSDNEFAYEENNFVVPQVDLLEEEENKKKKDKKGPKIISQDTEDENEIETKTKKGPKAAELKIDDEEIDEKNSHFASSEKDNKEIKGPKQAGLNFDDETEEETEIIKGPKAAGLSKFEAEEETSARVKSFAIGEEVEIPAIEPENEYFEFDEEKAKRTVQHSLQMGKIIGYSKEELKELEIVAYNCDIGITNFKKTDINKKGFRKMKAIASYEKLKEDGVIPYHLAEMVKSCTSAYESDSLSLEAKIPYSHIVAIASFYEDALSKGKDKSTILLKMLQLGGHQFNIFVLHKFIKMMRDANE